MEVDTGGRGTVPVESMTPKAEHVDLPEFAVQAGARGWFVQRVRSHVHPDLVKFYDTKDAAQEVCDRRNREWPRTP